MAATPQFGKLVRPLVKGLSDRLNAGASFAALAAESGLPEPVIVALILDWQPSPRPQRKLPAAGTVPSGLTSGGTTMATKWVTVPRLREQVVALRAEGLNATAIAKRLRLPIGQVHRTIEEVNLRDQLRLSRAGRFRRTAPVETLDPTYVVQGVLPPSARQPARLAPQRASEQRALRENAARVTTRYRLRDPDTGLLLGAAGVGVVAEPAHAWIGTSRHLAALRRRHPCLVAWQLVEVPPYDSVRTPWLQMGMRA